MSGPVIRNATLRWFMYGAPWRTADGVLPGEMEQYTWLMKRRIDEARKAWQREKKNGRRPMATYD